MIKKSAQLRALHIVNQIKSHRGFSPSIVYKIESTNYDGFYGSFDSDGIEILSLGDNSNLLSKYIFKLKRQLTSEDTKRLKDFVKDADVLHFHYGSDMGIYYPFLKINKIPTVVSFYGYDCSSFPNIFFGYGKRYLQKRVYPFVQTALSMSPDMKEDLIKAGCPEEKIQVHYFGSEIKSFFGVREYNKNKQVTFLNISNFVDKKGHIFLLKAFQKAYLQNQNIRLIIVGTGHLKRKIQRKIKEIALSDCIQLRDSVLHASEEHKQYLCDADVFIHPSVTASNGAKEGIPGSIVEAMASGLPVISTFHAGIPYVIKNEDTGILVDEWDIEALSKSILKMTDANLRKDLGLRAQEYAAKNLDVEEKGKDLENIYRSLIKN